MIRWMPLFLLLPLSGCCFPQAQPTKPVPAATIAYTVEDREAYGRVLRSIVKADLSVDLKDVDGGVVQTDWHMSRPEVIGLGSTLERRVRFKIIMAGGSCSVKPQSDRRIRLDSRSGWSSWESSDGFTDFEEAVFKRLLERIRADLTAEVDSNPAQP